LLFEQSQERFVRTRVFPDKKPKSNNQSERIGVAGSTLNLSDNFPSKKASAAGSALPYARRGLSAEAV
jgi:hypothetical protein